MEVYNMQKCLTLPLFENFRTGNFPQGFFTAGGASETTLDTFLLLADGLLVLCVTKLKGAVVMLEGVDTGWTTGVSCIE